MCEKQHLHAYLVVLQKTVSSSTKSCIFMLKTRFGTNPCAGSKKSSIGMLFTSFGRNPQAGCAKSSICMHILWFCRKLYPRLPKVAYSCLKRVLAQIHVRVLKRAALACFSRRLVEIHTRVLPKAPFACISCGFAENCILVYQKFHIHA